MSSSSLLYGFEFFIDGIRVSPEHLKFDRLKNSYEFEGVEIKMVEGNVRAKEPKVIGPRFISPVAVRRM